MSKKSDDNPFERARQIRRGDLDDEMPMFEELTGWVQRMPMSMLPAMLTQVIASCLHKGVFKEGKLVSFVCRMVDQWDEPGHGVLREHLGER